MTHFTDTVELNEFISGLPKAELHLHLEGSVQPEVWARLAGRNDPHLSVTPDDFREMLKYNSLSDFLFAFMALTSCFREPDDFRLAALECGRELARHNVVYAEIHTSAAAGLSIGIPPREIMDAVITGLNEARSEGGPEWGLIVDVIREMAVKDQGEIGLELAMEYRNRGVVAIGLGGNEAKIPTSEAAALFRAARDAGMHRTAHAGEAAGPESIRQALDIGAERIGHGVAAREDPELLCLLRDFRIPLEMCPSSNVCTGAVASMEEHPIADYLRQGLLVTLSTDDPPFFHTDMNTEYARVAEAFDLSPAEIIQLSKNAFDAAFGVIPKSGFRF